MPLVPVMPAMVSAWEGAPKKRAAIVPTCSVSAGTAARYTPAGTAGAAAPAAGSYSTARAPRASASGRNLSPWCVRPRQARNSAPGVTARLSSVTSLTVRSAGTAAIPAVSSASARPRGHAGGAHGSAAVRTVPSAGLAGSSSGVFTG